MTHFEYVMVIVSIILGLGLTVVLRGLSKLARSAKPSAVVAIWGFFLLFLFLQTWWGMWDMNQIEQWTQPDFLFVAIYACILYGMAELMLPMASRPDTDWNAHFLSIRVWYFSLQTFLAILAITLTWSQLDVPLTHPYRIVQSFIVIMSLIALTTRNMRVHLWIAVSVIVGLQAGQIVFRLIPGLQG